MQIKENNGIIFPKFISKFYFTDIMDLKMASNYKQFCDSGFSKHLKMLSYFENDFNLFDMTGNIGCDAVNFATVLNTNTIFTCEFEKEKAQCLKKNCEKMNNIFVFSGDSDILLNHIINKDITKIIEMCISENKHRLKKSLFENKWVINIDPPFGEDYDKSNETCTLEFCGQEILKYLKKYDVKFSKNVIEYIIKSPSNWDRLVKNDMDKFEINYVKTRHSDFFYNVYYSFDLQTAFVGGMLLSDYMTNDNLTKIFNEYNKKYKLNIVSKLTENEFNEIIYDLILKSKSLKEFDIEILKFIEGTKIHTFKNGKKFFLLSQCHQKDFAKHLMFNNFAKCYSSNEISCKLFALKLDIINKVDMKQVFTKELETYELYETYAELLNLININDIEKSFKILDKNISNQILKNQSYYSLLPPAFSHIEILQTFQKLSL